MDAITDLWNAIDEGNARRVRALMSQVPNLVEAVGGYGVTPLMHAASCMGRSVEVIQAILEMGADINRQTEEGYTALHFAIDVNGEANLNTDEVIKTLVSAGADLTLRQHYGWTPLLRAVVEGTLAEVKALLAAGADPNETMPLDTLPAFNAGRTTLMGAVTNPEAEEIVEALLQAGADPLLRDSNGMTFFEYTDLVRRESGPGDFGEQVKRCARIAKGYVKNDRT